MLLIVLGGLLDKSYRSVLLCSIHNLGYKRQANLVSFSRTMEIAVFRAFAHVVRARVRVPHQHIGFDRGAILECRHKRSVDLYLEPRLGSSNG